MKTKELRTTAVRGSLLSAGVAMALGAALTTQGGEPAGLVGTALAPKQVHEAKTMFVQLESKDTGISVVNLYDDPRMWGDLYTEFQGGSIGTGVAIGDFDGDGKPDVFVVTKTHGCRLYRNLGGYRFEDVTSKAGVGAEPGAWNTGATFVDVNNDGLLDIYVCRFNAPNLLYINQGDGTFREMAASYGLDISDSSVMASFYDYDRDGWLDVYVTTNMLNASSGPSGQSGHLLHNNRNGTFTDVTKAAGISGSAQSHSASWWDYDGDGWPDLYVANDYGVPDKLYHNNRDGTFTNTIEQALPHTSFYSMGSDIGDVLNDGFVDLLVSDMAMTDHLKDQNSIAGARDKEEEMDGTPEAQKLHRSALYLATGTGRCLEAAYLAGIAATNWTWSVRFEDLDNDGRQDLFVTNGFYRDPNPDVYSRAVHMDTKAGMIKVLHEAEPLSETHLAYKNLGGLEFREVGAQWGLNQKGVAFGAAFGDLGGDGNLDLVYTNYEGEVTVLRNDCSEGNVVNVYLSGTASNRFGVGATVRIESKLGTQTRVLSLARGYMSSSEPMLHFGLGADDIIKRMLVTWPSGRTQEFFNEPVNRRFTVTEPSGISDPAQRTAPEAPQFEDAGVFSGLTFGSREEPAEESYLQHSVPVHLNRRGPSVAVGDIAGVRRDDVAVAGTTVEPVRLLMSSKEGSYSGAEGASMPIQTMADDGPILLFDASGAGRQDLLVTTGGNTLPEGSRDYQPRLLLNDGRGGFHPAADGTLPDLSINAGAVAAADFDRSGRLGVFIGGRLNPGHYPFAPRSALLANRGGRFEDVTDSVAPGLRNVGMVTSAVWSDVDGDGWPDLVLALEWGTVRYFHNDHGKVFEDWTNRAGFAAGGTGWWTSIAAADFNGDGRIDYAVGNTGLNSQYHGDKEHPALLYSGDFRGNGSAQLIEAYYEGDTVFPWRSRLGMAYAIPSVTKRFPLNVDYARAPLFRIVGSDKLAKARRFEATELRSGIFMSQPDGTFRFEALPRLAQISAIQGMVAGDFSGSGHADIVAVENTYAPIRADGRVDSGLGQLMRGDGHGNFDLPGPAKSGLVVPGDAKALAILDMDLDGRPDLLATRNNSTSIAFRNKGVAGRNSFSVRLRGLPGNPAAVGSRVTVTFKDGTSECYEVQAGGSYYGQSCPACFFGYSDGNSPQNIQVAWPSGATTNAAYVVGAKVIVAESPLQ